MTRLFCLLVLGFSLLFNTQSKAQNLVYQESFEGVFPPLGWALVNDGAGSNWSAVNGTAVTYEGNRAMTIFTSGNLPTNAWAITQAVNLNTNPVTISFYVRARTNVASDHLRFTVGNNGGTVNQTTVLLDSSNVNYINYRKWSVTYTPTSAGAYYFGFNCLSAALSSGLYLDSITVRQDFSLCTGTPLGGTATSTLSTVCNNSSPFTVRILGGTIAQSNLSYQWQQSTDNSNWNNIVNATDASLVGQTINATTWFRRQITCGNSGGGTANSTSVQVQFSGPVYGTLPITESFENGWQNSCAVRDRPGPNWRNGVASGDRSWRRNDDGAAGVWNTPTYGAYTPAASEGTTSARIHTSAMLTTDSNSLQLFVDASGSSSKRLVFDYINPLLYSSQPDSLRVFVSTDGGATRSRVGTVMTSANSWTEQAIDLDINSATTIIYFTAYGNYSGNGTDLGIDNVRFYVPAACTGTPVAGSLSAVITTPPACGGIPTYNFSVAGASSTSTGLTYQWQQSLDSANWTDIIGATGLTYQMGAQPVATFIRRKIACGGNAATTAGYKVNASGKVYLTIPFVQDFDETWINGCAVSDLPNAAWASSPSSGGLSWRRNDQGATAGWWYLSSGAYTPASASGTNSARFHSTEVASYSGTGELRLHVNASISGNKKLSFFYRNQSGSDTLGVAYSIDNGTTWVRINTQPLTTNTAWTQHEYTLSITNPTLIIRFSARGDWSSDIGLDKVEMVSLVPCAGTPVGGTTTIATRLCNDLPVRLGVTGATTTAPGISLQWQMSTDSLVWSNVVGATNDSLFTVKNSDTVYYRRIIRCNADSSISSVSRVLPESGIYATLPHYQSFEAAWQNSCGSSDKPAASWRNQFSTGNNSWRRSDDLNSGNWNYSSSGMYSPSAAAGSHSARFHSTSYQYASYNGSLDLLINCATPGPEKVLKYSVNHVSGFDTLMPQISYDGGLTFSNLRAPILPLYTTNTWRHFSDTFFTQSPTVVIRFRAGVSQSSNEYSDIGLDSVSVVAPTPCSGTPTPPTISGPSRVCNGFNFALTSTGFATPGTMSGQFYQWQASTNSGTTWTNLINATNPATITVVQIQPTQYRLMDSCGLTQQKGYSNVISVTERPDTSSYFPLTATGYVQSFENWQTRCVANELPDSFWIQKKILGDSTWRRNDQGTAAGWTNPSNGSLTPQSSFGMYSARFHSKRGSWQVYRGQMDFHVNVSTSPQLEIGFAYSNYLDNDSLVVLASTNGGQTFSRIAALPSQQIRGFVRHRLFLPNPSSRTIIRLEGVGATYDDDGSDVAVDSFYVIPRSCPVPPALVYNKAASAASWQTPTVGNYLDVKWELRNGGALGSGSNGLVNSATTSGNLASFGTLPTGTYLFGVRSNCTADSSVWNTVSFVVRSNDDCATPKIITPTAFGVPPVPVTDSTMHASPSAYSGCASTNPNDVFFRFTVPSNVNGNLMVRVNNRQSIGTGFSSSLRFQVYSSGYCSYNSNPGGCVYIDSTSLFAYSGNTFLIRVFSEPDFTGTTNFRQHRFDVSVSLPEPPPVCTQNVNPANNATGVNKDAVVLRWRVAPRAASYNVYLAGPLPGSTYWYYQANVQDTSYTIPYPLQPNVQYRFYIEPTSLQGTPNNCSSASNYTTFTTAPIANAPANDECNTLAAFTLPVSPSNFDTSTLSTFTTVGASASSQYNSCYSGTDDDVWMSFVATAQAHRVHTIRVASTTSGHAVVAYSGSCGNLNYLSCSQDNLFTMANLTIGQRYFLRVYTPYTSSDRLGGFKLVVTAVPPPPANDNCTNATNIVGLQSMSGTTVGATQQSYSNLYCNNNYMYAEDDVWYRFVPQVSGAASVVLNNTGSGNFNPAMAVYSGANCNLMSFMNCINATGGGANETLNMTGLVAGNVYYLQVFSATSSTQGGTFTLVYNGSTLPVQLSEFTGTAQPASNLLQWTTASEANNKGFGVELSLDGGRNFRSLGFVETKAGSSGNSNQPLSYQFSHDWSAQGLSAQRMWYRLVQTDLNGRTTYSKVVELAPKADGKQLLISTVYPNPAKDLVQVKLEGNTQQVRGATFVITDMAGRVVLSQPLAQGAVQQTLQVSKLAAGQYLIRLHCADGCTSPAVSLRKD